VRWIADLSLSISLVSPFFAFIPLFTSRFLALHFMNIVELTTLVLFTPIRFLSYSLYQMLFSRVPGLVSGCGFVSVVFDQRLNGHGYLGPNYRNMPGTSDAGVSRAGHARLRLLHHVRALLEEPVLYFFCVFCFTTVAQTLLLF